MLTRILVVDDEPHFERLILQRFRRNIRQKEFEFFFAENGQDAIDKLAKFDDIDLILSDINMPKMDGLQFLAHLHQENAPQKTIMISAYGDMQNIRAAMNQGAYDFVTKPIEFKDLEITIKKAIKEIEVLKAAKKTEEALFSIQKELAAASQIQQSILPRNFLEISKKTSFSLYAKMLPAKEVGGDFYDFFFIDDHHLAIIIGDVSGKGMPAALFMAVSRSLLKALGMRNKTVGECMEQVNSLLCQDNEASMFVTVFYGILDLQASKLSYVSAGHNPPYLIHDQQITCLEDNQFPALGIIDGISFEPKQVEFTEEASLLLFTDGLTEALNEKQEFYGEESLEALLKSKSFETSEELINEVLKSVNHFTADQAQSDDLTMLSIKREQ